MMARITIKDIPKELRARLKREADGNFRSVNQEALARIERSFEMDNAVSAKRDQKWINEALASGRATQWTKREMIVIHDRVLKRKTVKVRTRET